MKLKDIEDIIAKRDKEGIDVFRCVITLSEEDAYSLGYNTKEKWKELVDSKIDDIVQNMKPPIPKDSLEYIAAYHDKNPNQHVHLTFWNKNQKDFSKLPFMNYDKIRKALSKEVYKERLDTIYYSKKSKIEQELKTMTKDDLEKYKDGLKSKLKTCGDIELKFVDTTNEEKFIKDATKNMKLFDKIYIYDKNNPNLFTEISKLNLKYMDNKDKEKPIDELEKKYGSYLRYKNNGEKGLIYNKNTLEDTACFLKDTSKLNVAFSEEEFQKTLEEFESRQEENLDYIKEVEPDVLPSHFFSNKFKESYIPDISNEIFKLKNTLEKQMQEENKKLNFKYGYYSKETKEQIDKISNLVFNCSEDCKKEFNDYVENYLEMEKLKGTNLSSKQNYINVKLTAEKEMYNIMGNQILQFIKENIIEAKSEKWEEIKLNREERKLKFEERKNLNKMLNENVRQEQLQKYQTKQMIRGMSRAMGSANTSMSRKNKFFKT